MTTRSMKQQVVWLPIMALATLMSLASPAGAADDAGPSATPAGDYDFHAMLQPVPMTAKFSDPDYFIWCGTMVKGDATKEIVWEGGQKQNLITLERPQVFFENGRPSVLLFASTDSAKSEHSFNVRIPLYSR